MINRFLGKQMLSSLEYTIGAVCENDFVLREFSFSVLWKQIKENQISSLRKCSIFKDKMKLLKTGKPSWGYQ